MRMLIILAALGIFTTGCGQYTIVKTSVSKIRKLDNQDVLVINNGTRDVSVCIAPDKKVVKDTDWKCWPVVEQVARRSSYGM